MVHTAPAVAVELLGRAVAAIGPEHHAQPVLQSRLAQAYHWLDRYEETVTHAEAVLRRSTDGELVGRMRVQLVRAAGRIQRYTDALAVVASGLDDPSVPPRWRARLAAWSSQIPAELGRLADARARAEETLALAQECDDPFSAAFAYHAMALVDPAARYELRDKAMAILGEEDADADTADLRIILIARRLSGFMEDARWSEYDAELPQALILAERMATARAMMIPAEAAIASYIRGRWDEAIAHVAGMPDVYEGRMAYVHGVVAIIAFSRDQPELAEQHLRAAGLTDDTDPAELPFPDSYVLGEALAVRAEVAGDTTAALALRSRWLDLSPTNQVGFSEMAPDLVRLALDVGDRDIASAAAAAFATPTTPPSWLQTVTAGCCQALLNDDPDALLEQADQYRQHGYLPLQAFALEEAAVRLAQASQAAAARAALTAAVQLYAEMDAAWRIRRADRRLRPYDVRRGRRSIQARAKFGWEALTPSEQRVAHLVGQGLSNPDVATELFVSRATVQTHMSSILRKLQMRSRFELIRELAKGA